jgi:hypothetical protein
MKVNITRQASADIATQFTANNLLEVVTVDAEEVVEAVVTPEADTTVAPEVAPTPEVTPEAAPVDPTPVAPTE